MGITILHSSKLPKSVRDMIVEVENLDAEIVRVEGFMAAHRATISERQKSKRYPEDLRVADAAKVGRLRARLDGLTERRDRLARAVRQERLNEAVPILIHEQKQMTEIASQSVPEAVEVLRKFHLAFGALVRLEKLEHQHERRTGSASRQIAGVLEIDPNFSPPRSPGAEFPCSSSDLRRAMLACLQSGGVAPLVDDFRGLVDRGFSHEEFDDEGSPHRAVLGVVEEEDELTDAPFAPTAEDVAADAGCYDEVGAVQDDDAEAADGGDSDEEE